MKNYIKSEIFDKMGLTSLAKRERGEKIEDDNRERYYKVHNNNIHTVLVGGTIIHPQGWMYVTLTQKTVERIAKNYNGIEISDPIPVKKGK